MYDRCTPARLTTQGRLSLGRSETVLRSRASFISTITPCFQTSLQPFTRRLKGRATWCKAMIFFPAALDWSSWQCLTAFITLARGISSKSVKITRASPGMSGRCLKRSCHTQFLCETWMDQTPLVRLPVGKFRNLSTWWAYSSHVSRSRYSIRGRCSRNLSFWFWKCRGFLSPRKLKADSGTTTTSAMCSSSKSRISRKSSSAPPPMPEITSIIMGAFVLSFPLSRLLAYSGSLQSGSCLPGRFSGRSGAGGGASTSAANMRIKASRRSLSIFMICGLPGSSMPQQQSIP
mmetsp:Transcript_84424/g.217426  ORF Transcript_84424/g.217426 Transcript_84424/m.217426 type:complete len:290 (-) Transcript_84424:227-1096(-)